MVSPTPPSTILIVDDEKSLVETIKAYLEREGYDVLCARNGKRAQDILLENDVSMVLLDLMLPGISGETICERLRDGSYGQKKKSIPVIMLTAKAGERNVIAGLNLGADDYLTKPFSPRELVARIKALERRTAPAQTNAAKTGAPKKEPPFTRGALLVDSENHAASVDGNPLALTPIEFSLLALLAKNTGRVFSREELLAAVVSDTEEEGETDARTVDSHIKNLRKKLALPYIETIYGMGYRFRTPS